MELGWPGATFAGTALGLVAAAALFVCAGRLRPAGDALTPAHGL